MLPRPRGKIFFAVACAVCLLGIPLTIYSTVTANEKSRSNVICRDNLSAAAREGLAAKLRKITGWSELRFDRNGVLRLGRTDPPRGSGTARELLARAVYGNNVVVLEDSNRREEVAFSRVIPGRWKHQAPDSPPAFVVQIDFADFDLVVGDRPALEAFDVGWGLLHELDHIVNDSHDGSSLGETGECENHINQMRRECNLPERADYFYTFSPLTTDSVFRTRLVRLAFELEEAPTNKKKRYWLTWDARVVGGFEEPKQIALR